MQVLSQRRSTLRAAWTTFVNSAQTAVSTSQQPEQDQPYERIFQQENDDQEHTTAVNVGSASAWWDYRQERLSLVESYPFASFLAILGTGWVIGLFYVYPFPQTISLFIAGAITLSAWTAVQIYLIAINYISFKEFLPLKEWSRKKSVAFGISLLLLSFLASRGLTPPTIDLPNLPPTDKYFIAANLYNSQAILPRWEASLLQLVNYLGPERVFVSIVESNSKDRTKHILESMADTFARNGIANRILSYDDNTRWWPHGVSPERIWYLANVRNQVLAPLQDEDDKIRLPDHDTYTKILFLNDIYFDWQSIVRLIDTRLDTQNNSTKYDLACAVDFGSSGLYDTWVARDVCGTPFRTFWPYVKDRATLQRIKEEKPFEVASCWNGVVSMPAEPYLWKNATGRLHTRGWRMLDNATYPGSIASPNLTDPLRFRGPSTPACDHSECFLFSYDLHRLYHGIRRPRIYMNPSVKVAYEANWFRWHNTVLRIPAVKAWVDIWSRGWPLVLVDWIWEAASRKRDYCTWAGLNIPDRCPALPGPHNEGWHTG